MPDRIRIATPDDARGIATAHVLAWQSAYRGLVAQEHLDALSIDRRETGWKQILTDAATRRQRVLVWDADGIEGFICVGPSRDQDVDPSSVGELQAIYLIPSAWRQGIGHALHDAGMDLLRLRDCTEATLWVLEGNERAIAFYEDQGWRADGTTKHEVWDGTPLDEVRFRLSLSSAPASAHSGSAPN